MPSAHEQMAHDYLTGLLDEPDRAAAFAQYRADLRDLNGKHSPDYVAAVGQIHGATAATWPLEQQAALFGFWLQDLQARYGRVRVAVHATPAADADREANTAAMAGLPPPFTAIVDPRQKNADADGVLRWSRPITVQANVADSAFYVHCPQHATRTAEPLTVPITIRPGEVPLEIGSTLPSRTVLHMSRLGVARWPYDVQEIWLFLNLDYWSDEPSPV